MKKLLLYECAVAAFLVVVFIIIVNAQPTIPAKLFDVRNGNGIVDAGTTYPQATVIVFKDKAAKDAIIEAFAAEYGYQTTVADNDRPRQTIPNPKSKQAFMNEKLTDFVRDVYRAHKLKTAEAAAKKTAGDAADAELPIKP